MLQKPTVKTVITMPPLPSLTIISSGVRYALSLVFEPLYSPKGELMAVETLTRLQLSTRDTNLAAPSPTDFYAALSSEVSERILVWQLGCLHRLADWLAAHQILVSFNVNRGLAYCCLRQARMLRALRPWLRIEINEHFFTLGEDPANDELLCRLEQLCPLWLDDFGTGSANLHALLSGKFEAIKLDTRIFHHFSRSLNGALFIEALRKTADEVGTQLILEGVETAIHLAGLQQSGAWALQGFYWDTLIPPALVSFGN